MIIKDNIENRPKISIIMPVYQVAKYLRQCLDRILMQSFPDWELLLIDDGSTDGSEAICDEYAHQDKRIMVFHRENAGQSVARNFGLDHANGDYITMIDADDLLLSCRYLEVLYQAILNHDARISICMYSEIHRNAFPDMEEIIGDEMLVSGKDIFRGDVICYGFRINTPFLKLYHRSCFNDIRFPEGRRLEDVAIMHRVLYPCDRIVMIDATMYGYRINPEGTMRSTRKSTLYYDMLAAKKDRENYFLAEKDDKAFNRTLRVFRPMIVSCFIDCIKDNSIDDIPPEDRPSLSDLHADYRHKGNIHRFFLQYDPKLQKEYTRSFLRNEFITLGKVLRIAKSTALGELSYYDEQLTSEEELEYIVKFSRATLLRALISDYAVETALVGSEEIKACEQDNRRILRQYIIREKRVQDITNAAEKSGIALVPVIDAVLAPLYVKPWLRNRDRDIIIYPLDKRDRIDAIMAGKGFIRAEDGKQHDFVRWDHSDGTTLNLVEDLSHIVPEDQKAFFSDMSKRMIFDKKAGEIDCALYLLASINTCLKNPKHIGFQDLLDLYMLLEENPHIIHTKEFKGSVMELELGDVWETFCSLTEKLLREESEEKKNIYSTKEIQMTAALLK